MSSNGKGSKQRPTNLKKFRKNFDKAFKKDKKDILAQADININPDTGAITVKNKDGSIQRREKKIVVKREYVDQNGIEMCIVNIDDALTNKIMSKKMLQALEHNVVNEEHPDALKAKQLTEELDSKLKSQSQEQIDNKKAT